MAKIALRAVRLFSLSTVLFSFNLVYSQSQNTDAIKWYSLANQEQDNSKKITAYLEAVAHDPKLVEAYLGLGVVYKSQADYKNAEKYLVKAYAAKLTEIDDELKSNILFELAGAYRLLGKNEAAEDALKGAQNLTADQNLLSRISLDLGGILFQQKHFKESLEVLNRGLMTTAEPPSHYKNLLHAAQKMVELEQIYNTALQAGADGDYKKAKNLFEQIQKSVPGFKNVEQKIVEMKTQLGEGAGSTRIKKVEAIIIEGTSVVTADIPPIEKGIPLQQNNPEQDAKPESMGRVKNGVSIPNASNQTETIDELGEQLAQPDSNNGLLAVDTAPNKSNPPDAIQDWDTAAHEQKGGFYSNGITEPQSDFDSSRQSLVAGFALGVFITPVIALLAFFPTARARFYILFRQNDRASEIYERILVKHPEKLWVYPALAKMYDICGRKDQRAIQVYKMLRHLNGQSKNGSNFNTAIANKYLHNQNNNTHTV